MIIVGILLFMAVVLQLAVACTTLAIFGLLQEKTEGGCGWRDASKG